MCHMSSYRHFCNHSCTLCVQTSSGMTKVKVGKEDLSSAEFVEKRRAALERYLKKKKTSHTSSFG